MDTDEADYLSEEEGFIEDALTNEEYDQLYELLPQVKKALASYNDTIDELSIKEAIHYNYFELEPTLEDLKSRFPKKKGIGAPNLVEGNRLSRTGGNGAGLSKLAALAQSRRADKSGISKLSAASTPSPESSKPKLVRKTNLAGLALKERARAKNEAKGSLSSSVERSSPDTMEVDVKESKPSFDFTLQVGEIDLLYTPAQEVSVFLFGGECQASLEPCRKRRRHNPELFYAYTNSVLTAKAKSNFSSPSPDDVVLTAQKQAFETDMSKLNIGEKEKKTQDNNNKEKKIPAPTKPFKSVDLAKELAGNPNFTKPNKSFVIIGHVDAGKSTLVGRILYDVGAVESKTMVKLVREAEKSNKGSFALAWIMDQTSEERSRGVTIDICATNFETPETRYTAIDAPGHKDFVPQMISGVSQADAALLVVDSITGEFETGFMMNGQTKEHTLLAKNLGIDELIVVVNKMDKENWDENRFKEIQESLQEYLTKPEVGFKEENISFIPLSGLTGYNVVKNDGSIKELSWYQGPTLLEALSKIHTSSVEANSVTSLESSDFTLAINDIADVTNSEFKVKGKISSGIIQPGQTVCLQPAEEYLQVQNVFINNEAVDVAIAGQIASLRFKTSQFKNKTVEDISIGDLVVSLNSPLKAVRQCTATVNMFNITKPLLVGTPFVMFRSNASVAARISKVKKINGVKKKKMHLVSNQIAEVEIEIIGDRPLPLAKFEDNKALGRVVIRREGATVGAGIVTST
ncbi:hypothetical protein FT663_05478 [Candidozyma haemuli var. vulneris]|nr:hypothetical protein FT663_05478 [[Candida] haemuloni var. vulneris]KAF3987013.1 hypothetical protein FT662_04244 [[Candida] haemuloni var. vulneris]